MDLPRTQQTVQACHAAILSGREYKHSNDTHLVILQVDDEPELLTVKKYLTDHGIATQMFYEPDFGPLGNTALATDKIPESMKYLFEDFKLWSTKPSIVRKARRIIKKLGDLIDDSE